MGDRIVYPITIRVPVNCTLCYSAAEFARLRREGVTGREVLCTALAVFAFAQRFPGTVDDGAHLTRLLGRAVIRLRRKPRQFTRGSFRQYSVHVSAIALSTIGVLIREALSVLMLRLLSLHERAKQENEDLLRAIKSGDPSDPADILQRKRQ